MVYKKTKIMLGLDVPLDAAHGSLHSPPLGRCTDTPQCHDATQRNGSSTEDIDFRRSKPECL